MNSRHSNETSSGSSYESKQPVLYAITIIFMVLETTAVILRFVSRRIGKVSWSRDDALIIASWAMTITFNVTILVDVRYGGTGLHMARIMETDPSMSVYFSQDILPVGITWILSVALSKLTVLSLYLSLFAIKRVTRYICYATGAIIILNCLGGISACFGVCVPLKALWDTGVAGHCFNLNMLLRWIRLPHILSDVIMLILPISHIIKLQTTRRIKFGLLISFLFGSVGFIFGLICWVQYFATDAIADKTWSAVNIFIWSILEAGMYLIAACLLAYHPIVSLIWKQVRKHFTGMSRTKSEPGSTRDYEMGLGSHDQIPDGRAFVPLSDKEEYIGLVTVAKVKQGQRGETVRSMN
ncbi:hypothetical protein ANOM_004939 [Aspergillus nomiae NRRL 13137]|uniref:Rhodopsin domain-containing protein n=1 Tax=Aspergillus nomiae NRRL (strain ATCC 15546 / NRRL 13137 / CBS 260.88 / M93) TaxID=1509407 RepID=A0A0L1J635_ASPN3|nr:uncharacterized protein ANOM_004939 [Aspergillus nomiae NRRL 13137]KNG87281.1 hypothetical protein ANOM_004939 [Aspergillus nomiae NRRL 13137]